MPETARIGKVGVYLEMSKDLQKRFRAFCKGRGEEFAVHVRYAMERHLANPPPSVDVVPLPAGVQPRKRGRPRKQQK